MPPKKKQKTIEGQSDLRSFFELGRSATSSTKKDTKSREATVKTGATNDNPIVLSDSDDSSVQSIHDINGEALTKTDANNIDVVDKDTSNNEDNNDVVDKDTSNNEDNNDVVDKDTSQRQKQLPPLSLKTFLMPIEGNRNARDLAWPHCESVLQHARDCNEIEGPQSDVLLHRHLLPRIITNNAAIYFRLDKIGSTSHFRDRIKHDIEKQKLKNINLQQDDYRLVHDFDNIGFEFNSHLECEYKNLMEKMMTGEGLSPGHRRLFEALHLHGGAKLGPKRSIMLQMLEYPLQKENAFADAAEFLMYDDDVVDRIYTQVKTDALEVLKALGIFEPYEDGTNFFLWAMCSWKTGASGDRYSSKIMTVRAALGEKHKDNWLDTIPVPAIWNAVTAEEIFCEAYSAEKRATGRQRLLGLFGRLFSDPNRPGMVFADTNKVIFDKDPDSQWNSIHEFIDHYWGNDLELVLNLRHEIYVYKHRSNRHYILVHRPLCLASSSIKGVRMKQRIKRGLTAGTLCNVQRFVNGLGFLSPTVKWGNIVDAMVAFQIYTNGLHGGHRQSAAMFRHFCRLDESENPLTQNGLGKIEGAVPMNLRTKRSRTERKQNRRRTTDDDRRVIPQARRLICSHPDLKGKCESEEDARKVVGPIFDKVMALFYEPNNMYAIKTRLDQLKKHFTADSFFPKLIDEHWRNHGRMNPGNSSAHKTSNRQIATNNNTCDGWIDKYAPKVGETRGDSFWIRMGKSKIDLKHINEAVSQVTHKYHDNWSFVEGDAFPGPCQEFYEGTLLFGGLQERLRKRNRIRETLHSRATRHTEYGLEQDKIVGTYDRNIFYTRVHLTFKNTSKGRPNREEVSNESESSDYDPSDDASDDGSDEVSYNTDYLSETESEWDPSDDGSDESSRNDTQEVSERTSIQQPDVGTSVQQPASIQQPDLPRLTEKQESHVAVLKDYYTKHEKFPSRKEGKQAIDWAKNYKSRFINGKLAGDHPIVIRLKAIGFMDYKPAENIKSGNKAWTNGDRDAVWDQRYDELKDFLSQPELGGFQALRKRNKNLAKEYKPLAKWVETNKPLYREKYWVKDEKTNAARHKKLQELGVDWS